MRTCEALLMNKRDICELAKAKTSMLEFSRVPQTKLLALAFVISYKTILSCILYHLQALLNVSRFCCLNVRYKEVSWEGSLEGDSPQSWLCTPRSLHERRGNNAVALGLIKRLKNVLAITGIFLDIFTYIWLTDDPRAGPSQDRK